jgi:membrane-associated phospholipid phosphatase
VREPRPTLRATAWLASLGPFFFASYGFANWLASQRADVGAVVFGWEHAIPFVPWTIVPYWSIDLLYAVSLFACTRRLELDRHALRLLAVQVISIACFIALPLRFSFDKPETDGVFGALFRTLGTFDKPFNQAPSLHIALLVVIWDRLAKNIRAPRWRWLLHAWMTLIGLSVLTTYQHHFIDLPTGLAVGFLALWMIPIEDRSPLFDLSLAPDRKRRGLAAIYGSAAVLCALVGTAGGVWLWMCWPAITLLLVSLNYLVIGGRGFQKSAAGTMSIGSWGLFAPYFAGAWINSRVWTRTHRKPAEVVDGVWIGRVPGRSDVFPAVVDLSAELPCPNPHAHLYRCVPVLDLTVPSAEDLRLAAESIEEGRGRGSVLVCCALGFSRSAAAVAAWLLVTRRAANVDEAMRMVRAARPAIVLNDEDTAALEVFA